MNTKYYFELYEAYGKAHPQLPKQRIQQDTNDIWNGIKKSENLPQKISEFKTKFREESLKVQAGLLSFWANIPRERRSTSTSQLNSEETPQIDNNVMTEENNEKASQVDYEASVCRKFNTPAQDAIRKKIDLLQSDLVGLLKRKSMGLLTSELEKELKSKEQEKNDLEKKLKRRILDQEVQRLARMRRKDSIEKLRNQVPDSEKILIVLEKPGRPSLEVDQPLILKTIIDIAIHGSAAHNRRQADMYRSVKTLDELHEELQRYGFQISRSVLYIRLLPKRSSSNEGKRHVTTVPVRLIRAENNQHKEHIDAKFCTATIRSLEELASVLGPKEVIFFSQDDKAKVPLGLTAAKKQSPMVMHLEYRVTLPDHDFVVASRHKLTPSVYGGIEIKPNCFDKTKAVGYSGPTYAAIRSGKHSSSTAFSHALDFERTLVLPEFDTLTKNEGVLKPVMIVTVDGGPDENPRYQKTIDANIHHFVKNNFDAMFIGTNAPHRSAYNRIERRMAPLSKELAGLILPHDHYGSHLNGQGITIDVELEKLNFQYAGETLAEIWSNLEIDKFPVVAEFISSNKSELEASEMISKSQQWFATHVRTSQYFTQIVKCHDESCCSPPRSSYFKLFPDRFLPPPIPIEQTVDGIITHKDTATATNFCSLFLNRILTGKVLPKSTEKFKILPYDMYCPSVQTSLDKRICKICDIYFASQVMLKQHAVIHNMEINVPKVRPVRVAAKRQREIMAIIALNELGDEDAEWFNEDDIIVSQNCLDVICRERNDRLPILSIDEYLRSPWEDDVKK